MTGKISEDSDKTSLTGNEKVAAALSGTNYGIKLSSIAAWLASLGQTLTNKVIDAGSNTITGMANSYNGRTGNVVGLFADVPLMNYLTGLTLSTAGSSSTFGIAVGVATDTTKATMMSLASAITKTTGSWAVGSGNGSLDTGTIANNTWYHVYLIERSDTGVVDILISTSASSPTMPANYDRKRRIGSMKTNGSAQWVKFIQDGDVFVWDVPVQSVNANNPGTAAVTRTLSTPLGVRVRAQLFAAVEANNSNAGGGLYLSDLSVTDSAASAAIATVYVFTGGAANDFVLGAVASVMTDTSSQIRSRLQISGSGATIYISTVGWTDTRGK